MLIVIFHFCAMKCIHRTRENNLTCGIINDNLQLLLHTLLEMTQSLVKSWLILLYFYCMSGDT